jgi:hypothetical protein
MYTTVCNLLEAQQGDEFKIEKDHNLGRLCISGEKSIELLKRIIIPASDISVNEQKNISFFLNSMDSSLRLKNVWKNGNALALTIRDLRLSSDVTSSGPSSGPSSLQWPKESGVSGIWSNEYLNASLSSFPSEKIIQQLKSSQKFLKWNQSLKLIQSSFHSTVVTSSSLPSSSKASSDTSDRFQILLIRKSSEMKLFNKFEVDSSLANCWSIILPYFYVSSTWNACMKAGAVALGLEEMTLISRLKGELVFPNDYPDSTAGWNCWKDFYFKEVENVNKKPNPKRVSVTSCYSSISSLLTGESISYDEKDENEENVDENENSSGDSNPPNLSSERELSKDTENPFEREVKEIEQENEGVVSSNSFLIVRTREYYSSIIPASYSPPNYSDRSRSNSLSSESSQRVNNSNNHKGILHCFNHADWQFNEAFPERNEFITLIPRTLKPTFIFITLWPTSRGMPMTGSVLFQPTVKDLRLFVHHRISRKMLLASKQEKKNNKKIDQKSNNDVHDMIFDEDDGTEWKGIHFNFHEEEADHGRKVMGVVTNGYHPHTNKGKSSVAIALVNINMLNDMISWYYGRFSYPLSHSFLLFQNPRSKWLRPAVYQF